MSYRFDKPFDFYFVRHGITELNFRGLRCGGDRDVPLMDLGCDQTYLLAKQIQRLGIPLKLIRCGKLQRVRQTALIISGVLGGLPIEIDEDLKEREIGVWNERPLEESEDLIAQGVTPENGESEVKFKGRVAEALARLARTSSNQLIVSSKGVGRIFNSLLGGPGSLHVSNGELIKFNVSLNDDGTPKLAIARPSFV